MAVDDSAWQDRAHAREFDTLSSFPDFLLKKRFESYNEVRLLRRHAPTILGARLFEIGCATGEFYRYLKLALPRFDYQGFDISRPALERAVQKFGPERFHRLGGGLDQIAREHGRPAVVFCRDVVLHQSRPLEFLDALLALAEEAVVLRLRTRERGATVWNIEQSCQKHYGRYWVPYIVINTDELLTHLKGRPGVAGIALSRRYEPLGGHTSRFLPKELYDAEFGSAETAVYIAKHPAADPARAKVVFDDAPDGPRFSLLERAILKAARAVAR